MSCLNVRSILLVVIILDFTRACTKIYNFEGLTVHCRGDHSVPAEYLREIYQNGSSVIKLKIEGVEADTLQNVLDMTEIASLTQLEIALTSCENISEEWFKHLTILNDLVIRDCSVSFFHKDAFASLTSLETLDLNNASLTEFPLYVLRSLKGLISLYIRYNVILSIEGPIPLPSATKLFLNFNELQVISDDILVECKSLQGLYLGNNKLKKLSLSYVPETLNHIILNDNYLSGEADLSLKFNLVDLNLRRNMIQTLNRNSFGSNPPESIGLVGNNLTCSCEMIWILNYISKSDIYTLNCLYATDVNVKNESNFYTFLNTTCEGYTGEIETSSPSSTDGTTEVTKTETTSESTQNTPSKEPTTNLDEGYTGEIETSSTSITEVTTELTKTESTSEGPQSTPSKEPTTNLDEGYTGEIETSTPSSTKPTTEGEIVSEKPSCLKSPWLNNNYKDFIDKESDGLKWNVEKLKNDSRHFVTIKYKTQDSSTSLFRTVRVDVGGYNLSADETMACLVDEKAAQYSNIHYCVVRPSDNKINLALYVALPVMGILILASGLMGYYYQAYRITIIERENSKSGKNTEQDDTNSTSCRHSIIRSFSDVSSGYINDESGGFPTRVRSISISTSYVSVLSDVSLDHDIFNTGREVPEDCRCVSSSSGYLSQSPSSTILEDCTDIQIESLPPLFNDTLDTDTVLNKLTRRSTKLKQDLTL